MKVWFTKWLIGFGELLVACLVAFSQTNWSSRGSAGEIMSAALQSARDYQTAWEGKKPPGFEYGVYEIPSKYWTDAIQELKPVKVYNHLLNFAIVLSIRDGVEEGIYISNPISSEAPFVGSVRPD